MGCVGGGVDFDAPAGQVQIEMVPKGSGSENNSFLKMYCRPRAWMRSRPSSSTGAPVAGGKTCPPTIVGVGLGGTSDLAVALAKALPRARWAATSRRRRRKPEAQLSVAVNQLGVGPTGLGGDSTAFAVHIEPGGHAHHEMNRIAVNMRHSARRARATFTPEGVTYGF